MTTVRNVTAAAWLASVLGLSSALAGRTTTIAAIVQAPEDNAQVSVVGTVAETYEYGGDSLYTLAADGSRITVMSRHPAPSPDARLEVSGTVRVARTGRRPDRLPPVLFESTRRTAPLASG